MSTSPGMMPGRLPIFEERVLVWRRSNNSQQQTDATPMAGPQPSEPRSLGERHRIAPGVRRGVYHKIALAPRSLDGPMQDGMEAGASRRTRSVLKSPLIMNASNSTWVTSSSGVVLVSSAPDWRTRLIGVPFLVASIYLGYQIVASVGDAVAARDVSVIAIPGLLVMLVLFAAFAIPAVLLIAGRAEAVVDGTTREAIVRQRYGFHTREQRYPLASFVAVEVAHESDAIGPSNRRRPIRLSQFVVRLRLTDAQGSEPVVRLGYFNDDRVEDARRLAAEVAELAGLEWKDRSAGSVARQARASAAAQRGKVTGWRRVGQFILDVLFPSRG